MERFRIKDLKETLRDEVESLQRWLKEHSPMESAETKISKVFAALNEYKKTIDPGVKSEFLAEIEGTIVRLENEARIKETNAELDGIRQDETGVSTDKAKGGEQK